MSASHIRKPGSLLQSDDEYSREFGELPYISITVPADFVMFTLSLESASNNTAERGEELGRAYLALVQRVGRTTGIEMEVGDPGRTVPTETATASEVIIDGARRSNIPVVLKFDVRKGESFPQVRARATVPRADGRP